MNDYPHDLTLRSITQWPGKRTARPVRSAFSAPLSTTLRQLRTELQALAARATVLQVAIPEGQFRLDGRPRAGARAEHPGVILSFTSKHGPLTYATDVFDSWQDNLRAIVLSLEALRKVDRYGVSKSGEQYRGWKQLPAGTGAEATGWTVDKARDVLAKAAGQSPSDSAVDTLRELYHLAARRTHPDAGGDREDFELVQQAYEHLRSQGLVT